MHDHERKILLQELRAYKKEVTSSKESSRKFLKDVGIITEKGNLTKNYRNLCIPKELA
tara:strand:+ start:293 stop:466 length:174 start_codon:yes stop_codon:yes gene_type:complete